MIINKDYILSSIHLMMDRHLEIISKYIDMKSWELTEEEHASLNASFRAIYTYQAAIKHING
jgi:hypothetical protein